MSILEKYWVVGQFEIYGRLFNPDGLKTLKGFAKGFPDFIDGRFFVTTNEEISCRPFGTLNEPLPPWAQQSSAGPCELFTIESPFSQ
jgi:hypothetical protein